MDHDSPPSPPSLPVEVNESELRLKFGDISRTGTDDALALAAALKLRPGSALNVGALRRHTAIHVGTGKDCGGGRQKTVFPTSA